MGVSQAGPGRSGIVAGVFRRVRTFLEGPLNVLLRLFYMMLRGLLVWSREMRHVLRREPVGMAMPLVALAVVLWVPQMPDMFVGMKVGFGHDGEPRTGWWRPLGFSVFAVTLGLAGWYWTRAALLASHVELDDAAGRFDRLPRVREEALNQSALNFTQALALAPLTVLIGAPGHGWDSAPVAAPVLGVFFLFVAFVFVFTWTRSEHRDDARTRTGAVWLRTTAVFAAAAPGGWLPALVFFGISLSGVWLVAAHPEVTERLHTPAVALLVLTLLVGPLTVALAFLRDLVALGRLVLRWLIRLLRWLPDRREGGAAPRLVAGVREWSEIRAWSGTPGLALFLVCIFVWPLLGEPPGLHLVRTTGVPLAEADAPCEAGADPRAPRRPCLAEALRAWIDARPEEHAAPGPMPVVIVAAEGGGSRAAVWLLSAMRRLDAATEGGFGRHLFAISGVSGGSLGAVTYLQALHAHAEERHGRRRPWLRWDHPRVAAGLDRLGDGDLLAASIATYILNDTLGRLLAPYWVGVPDRAEALERSFERHWAWGAALAVPRAQAEAGLVALWSGAPAGAPHLLLNGTDRETGRRLITSTLRFDPTDDLFTASDDLLGILGADVPASTAVTNSARFPYVTPAGRFMDKEKKPRQVLDGGYYENYGARTAAELARRIGEIGAERGLDLLPVVVVVSNDADASRLTPEEERERERRDPNWRRSPTLEETAVTCRPPSGEQASLLPVETVRERARAAGGGVGGVVGGGVLEIVVPLIGLYTTRVAHGQDALHILRRQLCPRPGENAPPRLFHIALPRPEPGKEAAPMNWVLNPAARHYLLDVAPEIPFNTRQAEAMRALFAAARREASHRQAASGPPAP